MSQTRLLFVCTANLCRSPMASAIADQIAMRRGLDIEVRSAGVRARQDLPAHPRVVAVCREVGLDLSGHRSQALTAEHVAWADRIAVMEGAHATAIRELCPEDGREDLIVQLGPLVGRALIEDPFGSFWTSSYRKARDQLYKAIERLLTRG